MIENLFGGGGGGGLQGVTAGTGISVDNTNPDNPIITNTSLNTDETAKVSSNDTTAGYLNGKLVAGSGITLTENNNGGNETLTIAAAVTSVNGSTGAVTIAAGDTTYPLTVLDAENTSATRDCVTFTIPGGTLADGEMIVLTTVTETLNNSGSTQSLSVRTVVGGTAASSYSTSYATSVLVWADRQQIFMWRSGSTFWINLPTTWAAPANVGYVLRTNDNTVNTGYASSTTPNFSNDLTVVLRFQWSVANASVYLRMRNARAVKFTGQYT